MGFNRRKMEDQRRNAAEKEAASRRATDAQVLEDAERLIAAWNERQALRAPMIFSPTIGGECLANDRGRTRAAGSGGASLRHTGLSGLDRRTWDRAVRTEYAAIARFWFIENLADVRWHPFHRSMSAVRASDDGH